jgi:hypothetical protein
MAVGRCSVFTSLAQADLTSHLISQKEMRIMLSSKIHETRESDVMTPEETACHLKKSTSRIYKNWKLLGGEKLRGCLFFSKMVIHQLLFGKKA